MGHHTDTCHSTASPPRCFHGERAVRLLVLLGVISCAIPGSRCAADDSPTAEPQVAIQRVSSERKYELGTARLRAEPYIDRKYSLRKLPERLVDARMVRTSMDDDYVATDDHLRLELPGTTEVLVAVDTRGERLPGWMNGWTLCDESLTVDNIEYRLYHRIVAAGVVILGGNDRSKTGARSNYFVLLLPSQARPATPARQFAADQFEQQVWPLLQQRCHACHGADLQEGGLRLDVRSRALQGGDTAVAIVPGSSERSELLARLTTDNPARRMPQGDEALASSEISLLKTWIEGGAPWPDPLAGRETPSTHWAYQPIGSPVVPEVGLVGWGHNPIDAFVLSRLEQAGLVPSPEADRSTLIRRLSLDLRGIPPAPEELQAFVNETSPDAWNRLVDRFLAAPQFGERWARHWLDLARFAESDGYENDNPRPHAWRFRDWVINATNADLPFDQFTIEQLAGDLVDDGSAASRIATGFHRNTLHNSAGGADGEEFRTRAVKDRTAVTATVWLGLTWQCAECHTHKYDPIAQREYYQLYAFFNDADHDQVGEAATLRKTERVTRVHRRGNFLEPAAEVPPGVPAFLPELTPRGERPDRLDLARWLVSPAQPLTPRVAVNTVWQHLLGVGLVPTPDNFGVRGEPATHPELLDWLAGEFAGRTPGQRWIEPWSRKSLIRLIVTSAVYRQSSRQPKEPPAADPTNRLLWRQNRVRLESEVVRDVALSASGLLVAELGGPSIQPVLPRGLGQLSELKNERFQETSGNPYRRGLYVHTQRTYPYPMFATFDGADGNACLVLRDRSTTPLQALTLLNDPAIDDCARRLGERLQEGTLDDTHRLVLGCHLCLSRDPGEPEREILQRLVGELRDLSATEAQVWHGVARALLNLEETITRE
jgi:mono/diheme cytochrome c family protein